jgi:hypothetical protein
MLKYFKELIDKDYVSDVNMITGDLKQILEELKDIITLIQDPTYIEDDLREFVNIIRNSDNALTLAQNRDGLRIKF